MSVRYRDNVSKRCYFKLEIDKCAFVQIEKE